MLDDTSQPLSQLYIRSWANIIKEKENEWNLMQRERMEIPLRASKDVFIDIRLFMLCIYFLQLLFSSSTTFAISLCTILCLFLVSIRETNNAFEAPDEVKRFKRSGFEKENFTQSIIALQHQSSLSYLISQLSHINWFSGTKRWSAKAIKAHSCLFI